MEDLSIDITSVNATEFDDLSQNIVKALKDLDMLITVNQDNIVKSPPKIPLLCQYVSKYAKQESLNYSGFCGSSINGMYVHFFRYEAED